MKCQTSVVWQTIDYAYYAIQAMQLQSSDASKLRFSVCCTDKPSYEFIKSSKEFRDLGIECYELQCKDVGRGSVQHAASVQAMLSQADTGDTNLIFDSDTVVLKEGWDTDVEEQLKLVDVFGASYEESYSGWEDVPYQKCPNFSFLAFRQDVSWNGFDPTTAKNQNVLMVSEEDAETNGLKVGDRLRCEVGWRLPSFLRSRSKTWKSMPAVSSKTGRTLFSRNEDSTYFLQHDLDGKPFLAHMQRSLRNPFFQSDASRTFIREIEKFLKFE